MSPGAGGNIATEDVVLLRREMGFETGIDLGLLRQASRRIESFLGRALATRLTANPNPSAARR
jgi:hydroxymethylglutaryl-CoA lyase